MYDFVEGFILASLLTREHLYILIKNNFLKCLLVAAIVVQKFFCNNSHITGSPDCGIP